MSLKNSLLLLYVLLAACGGRQGGQADVTQVPDNSLAYAHPESLIEAESLRPVKDKEHIKIIDFRERKAFDKGHIPNAIPIWRSDIEDHSHPVRGMMAAKTEVEKLLSTSGISSRDTLILYDDNGDVNAARLWWVLKAYGFEQVRLLNGGWQSWQVQEGEISTSYTPGPNATFRFPNGDALHIRITKDSLYSLLEKEQWTLIDARTTHEHSGKRRKKGAGMAGRIPGSLHIDWADAVDYYGTKKFRSPEELHNVYSGLPTNRDSPIVVYCHSGVRSAHTYFVLTQLLGYTRVYNYDGSWLEWSSLERAPIEKDSITSILE